MSQWREVDELLQDGRQRLHAAQLQMQQANDDPLAGTQQLIELNQTKPNADWVFLLQKLIIEGNLEGPSVHKLQTELSEQAETISNYRDFLRNYRTQKESFRRLVQGCSNKEIDFATYTHCLEEWKRIKELYIESPLHDPHLTREFVALDCLFQMVYFLAEPKGQDHGKVKLSISSLISKWDAEDLIMENDASAGLLNTFLSNQKDRFSLLGKRESQVRTVGHQPKVDGQSLNRRKRALPMVSCKPSTEKVYKEKKDCFNHKVYTSTKRLSSPYEQLESTRTQTLNLNSHSKIENSEINKLSQFSKTLTNLSYEELCETVKDKDLAQQQKVFASNLVPSRDHCSELRTSAKTGQRSLPRHH